MTGLQTSCWGPPAWFFLHSVTFGYPDEPTEEQQMNYFHFFKSLGHVLPCSHCRKNYYENLENLPVQNSLKSKKDLIKWLYDFHNLVNKDLGVKDSDIPSLKEVYQTYDDIKATNTNQEGVCMSGCTGNKKCELKVVDKFTETFTDAIKDSLKWLPAMLVAIVFIFVIGNYYNNIDKYKSSSKKNNFGKKKKFTYRKYIK